MRKYIKAPVLILALLFLLLSCDSNTPEPIVPTSNVETEAQLVEAISKGGKIKLTNDIELSDTLIVNSKSELDLNGHKLFNTNDIWKELSGEENRWSLVSVRGGGNLTIKGDGELAAKANDCFAADVQSGGHLTVEGGSFIGNIHAIYVYEGWLDINGGVFSIQQLEKGDKPYKFVINCLDENYTNGTAVVKVLEGSFQGYNPADAYSEPNAPVNFLIDKIGYKIMERNVDDVTWYDITKITK